VSVGGKPAPGYPPAEGFFPPRRTLAALARAADGCRACPLYRHATQAVFGEGPRGATMMLVGEQPGDQEDRQGRPFVGSAGRLLDECLAAVGLERDELWLTNAVKHFKFEPRGKRRIHKKPTVTEVQACFPWLEAELDKVAPAMIVCLGSTATRALLGPAVRVRRDRGKVFTNRWASWVMPTYHPSALLRAPDENRESVRQAFLADLRRAAERYRATGLHSARNVKLAAERTARSIESAGQPARPAGGSDDRSPATRRAR
jgi:uracil-DNA glycosylase